MKLSSRDRRERRKARRQRWNDIRNCRAHMVTVEEFSRRMGFPTAEADPLDAMMELVIGVRPLGVAIYQHEFSPKSRRS